MSAVVWFEVYVSDLDRAIAFHNALAGWEFGPLQGMPGDTYRQITNSPEGSVGGAVIAGFPERVGTGGTVVYVHVDDLDQAISRSIAAGGSKEAETQVINASDGQFALVRDPDGNLLGLWAPGQADFVTDSAHGAEGASTQDQSGVRGRRRRVD